MRIPVLGRILGTYLVKGIEYLVDRYSRKSQPLPFEQVRHINELQKNAGRMNTKTVKLPRTPNRYDE